MIKRTRHIPGLPDGALYYYSGDRAEVLEQKLQDATKHNKELLMSLQAEKRMNALMVGEREDSMVLLCDHVWPTEQKMTEQMMRQIVARCLHIQRELWHKYYGGLSEQPAPKTIDRIMRNISSTADLLLWVYRFQMRQEIPVFRSERDRKNDAEYRQAIDSLCRSIRTSILTGDLSPF